MKRKLPKFDAPPVVETAMSVQFAHLQKFSDAHAGWFWKTYLDDDWVDLKVAPALPDQFERYGKERQWIVPGAINLLPGGVPNRSQIVRADDEHMIQLQGSRFVYNWRKQTGSYPSYDKLLPEFKAKLGKFQEFAVEAGNSELKFNQWEITYVNHIPKGELWGTPRDWPDIVPCLAIPAAELTHQSLDSFGGQWCLAINETRGRLYVGVNHARIGSKQGPEMMVLQLTARGPVDERPGMSFEEGLCLGHDAIVNSFAAVTSGSAHKHWKRTA